MSEVNHIISFPDLKKVMKLLEGIPDPEVPVLNIIDLGIVRDVRVYPTPEVESNFVFHTDRNGLGVTVIITPTYVGCPAVDMIKATIQMTLTSAGYYPVEVRTTLFPAWTTEWLSEEARGKLEAFGIAPPNPVSSVCHLEPFQREEAVSCPRCRSCHTEMISPFGSTACKAMYRCLDCQEPFDYFKCH